MESNKEKHYALIERLQKICGENIEIKIVKEIDLNEAVMYLFEFDGCNTSAAIVYNDGTLFHQYDWQGGYPETTEEIDGFKWLSEDGKEAVIMNGLPKLFA